VFAVNRLGALGEVAAVSSLWETAPVGGVPQGDFLNAVVLLDTVRGPRPLLDGFLHIEAEAGRERRVRWGPRSLDLDLLLYDDAIVAAPGLQVPHPRLTERRFVLAPLAEVWPDAIVPGHGRLADLVSAVANQAMKWVEGPGWAPGSPQSPVTSPQ
jgi:2-amino-4-hydroxy-6-hydroxymethyldihydropteridine diphosphokinase